MPIARTAAIVAVILLTSSCASAGEARQPRPSPSQRAVVRSTTPLPAQTFVAPTDAAGRPMALVWMGEHYYAPSTLTIPVGTTVMWRMLGQQEHDVWAHDGSFHSPTMGPGSTFTHTFSEPGTFRYFCVPHGGDGMTGVVVVTPAG